MAPPAVLDHIIMVTTEARVQQFREAGFAVIAGGRHADGITGNYLIVLHDVYLELVYFIRPDPAHWWSDKKPGNWADFALLPLDKDGSFDFAKSVLRPDGTRFYLDPVDGGRQTEDGVQIKWKVTFIDAPKAERGRLPFLCEDLTPRSYRVPAHLPHPNGAERIRKLTVLAKPGKLSHYEQDLAAIIGSRLTTLQGAQVTLDVREPATDAERAWVDANGEGVYELSLQGSSSGAPDSAAVPAGIRL